MAMVFCFCFFFQGKFCHSVYFIFLLCFDLLASIIGVHGQNILIFSELLYFEKILSPLCLFEIAVTVRGKIGQKRFPKFICSMHYMSKLF